MSILNKNENHPIEPRHFTGLLAWMAQNHVAANLLMMALIIGGTIGLWDIRQEITPDFSLEAVRVTMSYPGASPEEVEEGIILAIESELQGEPDIDSITSTASEGNASVTAELVDGADAGQVLQDIRNKVSRITSFPDDVEPPKVELRTHGFYVISIGVAGELAELDLFNFVENIRFELLNMTGVSEVNVRGRREPQIIFEISQQQLRALKLTLDDVADAVEDAARDIPAGNIETRQGEILLRTQGRREKASEYHDIPIKNLSDGSQVILGDISTATEGFEEQSTVFEFNGRPGMRLDIYQSEKQNPIKLAKRIREYIQGINQQLPDTINVSINNDRSLRYEERKKILIKNGAMGLTLVVLALGLFLNLRLAFWVAISIPVVYIGTFILLPGLDVTLNMISLFAFILTLGIVVDDAIIVGENIYSKIEMGVPSTSAVITGVKEMLTPVVFAVATNILAFIPLIFVPGSSGQFLRALPIVACVVFAVSLVEALLILPAHLNHSNKKNRGKKEKSHRFIAKVLRPFKRVMRFHDAVARSLEQLREGAFMRLLKLAINERYITVLIFSGFLVLIVVWYSSGRIDLTWRPEIPGNRVDAEIDMPGDASIKETLAVVRKVEAAGLRAIEKLGGQQNLESWYTRAGYRRPTYGDVNMYLVSDHLRDFTQEEFTRQWRKEVGDLPEVKSLFFEYLVGPGGNRDLRLNLSHSNSTILESAATDLADQLSQLKGVVDVSSGIAEGKQQISFSLSAEALSLGIDESSLGSQIRHAFYGAEALRFLRNGNEVKVMISLPKEQRQSYQALQNFYVRAPDGTEIPLSRAAVFEQGNAYSTINREDGKRIFKVTASVDKAVANSRRIRASVEKTVLPELLARYPGLDGEFSGGRRDRNKAFKAIFSGLGWVILIIFACFAALFRSYTQSLIVMLTIPFAASAAIAGHVLMGFDLSSVSIFGMIALCGLVVNSSLVLTVRLNEIRQNTVNNARQALLEASRSRFRAIVLTALTTTAGLFPMLFETSTQALFLVPMAIALSFGTLASMFVVLFLIPALYAIRDDIIALWR